MPAETASRTFARLARLPEHAGRIEGVLADFWSGAPPRGARPPRRPSASGVGGAPAAVSRRRSSSSCRARSPASPGGGSRRPRRGRPGSSSRRTCPPRRATSRCRGRATASRSRARGSSSAQGATALSLLTVAEPLPLRAACPRAGDRPSSATCAARSRRCCSGARRSSTAGWSRVTGAAGSTTCSSSRACTSCSPRASSLSCCALAGVEGKARDALLLGGRRSLRPRRRRQPAGRARGPRRRRSSSPTRLLERPIRGRAGDRAFGARPLPRGAARRSSRSARVLTFAAVCGIALFAAPIRARLPDRPEWLFSGLAAALAAECRDGAGPPLEVQPRRGRRLADRAALDPALRAALIGLGALLLLFYALGLAAGPLAALFGRGLPAARVVRRAGGRDRVPAPDAAAGRVLRGRRRCSSLAGLGPRATARAGGRRRRDALSLPRAAPGAAGPRGGLLDRGARRRAGRRDTPALEAAGRCSWTAEGRSISTARDFGRTRLRAEAPRPRRDARSTPCS